MSDEKPRRRRTRSTRSRTPTTLPSSAAFGVGGGCSPATGGSASPAPASRRCGCCSRPTRACCASCGSTSATPRRRDAARKAELDAKFKLLPEPRRCAAWRCARSRTQIDTLARENPAFTVDLLQRRAAEARRPGARVRRAVGDLRALPGVPRLRRRRRDRARPAPLPADPRRAAKVRQARARAEEPGGAGEAQGEVRRDPRLPVVGARPARPHREHLPAARRSDRDDALAAGALAASSTSSSTASRPSARPPARPTSCCRPSSGSHSTLPAVRSHVRPRAHCPAAAQTLIVFRTGTA